MKTSELRVRAELSPPLARDVDHFEVEMKFGETALWRME